MLPSWSSTVYLLACSNPNTTVPLWMRPAQRCRAGAIRVCCMQPRQVGLKRTGQLVRGARTTRCPA